LKKILITGFEKFDDANSNPTQEMLIDLNYTKADVKCVVLPVEFESSFTQLQAEIEAFNPDYVLLCGLAGNRDHISIEKIAINYINARIPDNKGYQPFDTTISETGNDGYFSTLAVSELACHIQSLGIDLQVSFNAGSYVCNYLLYKTLEHLKGSAVKSTFFHFPPATSESSVKEYQRFVLEVLNFIVDAPEVTAQSITNSAAQFARED
jgi:pyroglutamyl-peptidase